MPGKAALSLVPWLFAIGCGLDTYGNSLAPLLTCSELTNPDGACGTICPLEESILDD